MKMRPVSSASFTPGRTTFGALEEAAHACHADAEWRAFQSVLAESLECVIDQAILCVVDIPEDVRALEHLRSLTRAHFAGVPMPLRMHDFLHALGILLAGFQVEPRSGRWAREDSAAHTVAVASERLRHVVEVAAFAAREQAEAASQGAAVELGYTVPPSPPSKRRSKPRRTHSASPLE